MKDIHIGSLIKEKVAESSMSIKEFSDKIHCDRTTVYDIFKRKSIDVERLLKISEVLNYNFLEEIYLKRERDLPPASPTVFIAVEIDKKDLSMLKLPEDLTYFIKEKE